MCLAVYLKTATGGRQSKGPLPDVKSTFAIVKDVHFLMLWACPAAKKDLDAIFDYNGISPLSEDQIKQVFEGQGDKQLSIY